MLNKVLEEDEAVDKQENEEFFWIYLNSGCFSKNTYLLNCIDGLVL